MQLRGPIAGSTCERLDASECWRLVRSRAVGRVGIVSGNELQITPVNYRADGEAVYFRATAFGPVSRHAHHQATVIEVDDIDSAGFSGWSVQLSGPTHHVVDGPTMAALWSPTQPHVWEAGQESIWIAMDVQDIQGQRVGP